MVVASGFPVRALSACRAAIITSILLLLLMLLLPLLLPHSYVVTSNTGAHCHGSFFRLARYCARSSVTKCHGHTFLYTNSLCLAKKDNASLWKMSCAQF